MTGVMVSLPLADRAASVTSGGVLTLVVPLALLIIVLAWWYVSLRRAR
jgi:hypothetical protein